MEGRDMKLAIYDNNGKTADRYTVIIGNDVYGMSTDANMPNGFNQFAGTIGEDFPMDFPSGVDVGHPITHWGLSSIVKSCVLDRMLSTS